MRLHRLIGLEIEALRNDYAETMQKIANYTKILDSRAEMAKVIIKDLQGIKKEYARERRTVIDNVEEAVVEEKPIEVIDVAVLIDKFAYARVIDMPTFERNKEAAEAESKKIVLCKNVDKLCLFTERGDMHTIKVLSLPFGKFRDKGQPIDNVEKGSKLNLTKENLIFADSMEHIVASKLIFGTKQAMIKLVDGTEFDVSRKLIAATKLSDKDEVICVKVINPNSTVVMQSAKDMFLRIDGDTIPEKKKTAVGVRGMKLGKGDELTNIYVLQEGENLDVKVKDKMISIGRLHVASRDTKGVKK